MPTYTYKCETCGHLFEVEHGVDEPGPDSCPAPAKDRLLTSHPPQVAVCQGRLKRQLYATPGWLR